MEIALNLKLRGRASSRFVCMSCMAERLDCAEQSLADMAAFYQENGCELFERQYVDEQEREGN